MSAEIKILPTPADVVTEAAERFLRLAESSIAERGRFLVALAGGSTPRALHEKLATKEYGSRIDWSKVHFFFGDERAVPVTHEYSNGHMAYETLLKHVPVVNSQVHYMRGDASDLNDAAREYGLLLQEYGTSLDLVYLGMGDDGHTASLFPYTPQLKEGKHRCVATPISPTEPQLPRLTLTYPALNAARNVVLLVTGAGKKPRLQQVLPLVRAGEANIDALPVTGIRPENGTLAWLLDEAAVPDES